MHRLRGRVVAVSALAAAAAATLTVAAAESAIPPAATQGRALFITAWNNAGADAGGNQHGLGPLYNAAACQTCHVDGQSGTGPQSTGPLPANLVIQLANGKPSQGRNAAGDPRCGSVFNVAAINDVAAEGKASVRYLETDGYYYPFGDHWRIRRPVYELQAGNCAPMAASTMLKPRLAPALFGLGLLELIPESALPPVTTHDYPAGRFGWQGSSSTLREQIAKALAREIGVTSSDFDTDDCTSAEPDCLRARGSASPEASDQQVEALLAYVRSLPAPPPQLDLPERATGAQLFESLRCSSCHLPQLPVEWQSADGTRMRSSVAPYTDLRLHDMGRGMADMTVGGAKVTSFWRTAPLWGLARRLARPGVLTLLHDGRARSVEEAILWHTGEATVARRRFMALYPDARRALIRWVESL